MRNPILPIADPFVTLHDGIYYATGTRTHTSLEIWAAPTLDALRDTSPTLVWSPGAAEPASQVWSPTMFLLPHDGDEHWYVYFTASIDGTNMGHRIFVLQSVGRDPLGPYRFRGSIRGLPESPAIDPSILFLHGTTYLLYVDEPGDGPEPDANVICIAPLHDPLSLEAPGRLIGFPDQPWERGEGAAQSTYPVAEGPTALHHGGRTFIVYSGSNTANYNYCLGLLTYDGHGDPMDGASWLKQGPVFTFSEAAGVFGPGRATFTTSVDGRDDWMLYHAKDTPAETGEGRTTRAQRFVWRPDGTPEFGSPVATGDRPDLPDDDRAGAPAPQHVDS